MLIWVKKSPRADRVSVPCYGGAIGVAPIVSTGLVIRRGRVAQKVPQFHIGSRFDHRDLIDAHREHGLGVTVFRPLCPHGVQELTVVLRSLARIGQWPHYVCRIKGHGHSRVSGTQDLPCQLDPSPVIFHRQGPEPVQGKGQLNFYLLPFWKGQRGVKKCPAGTDIARQEVEHLPLPGWMDNLEACRDVETEPL